ncbi:hypothetical protein [Mesorhizobium sp. BH1-1-4]|uniref:hypothetical protein n=1 Tax=Mesorhizobium sp. BH1-1-4 TaxID=2876662 RepID=UPI001CD07002|nr:hypothetical protein [Mesorhizobium sp. BH1-1-4]MBZ9996339.1 hypothetical protein [Mesorhizobium sp. BH1-1-4]
MGKSLKLKFPGAPTPEDEDKIIYALGRMTIAWSSSEHYLALLIMRLMGHVDLSDADKVQAAASGQPVSLIADTNAIFSIFLAIDSTRGRRKIAENIADARFDEHHISEEWWRKIKEILKAHEAIGKLRNKYAHTALARDDDGRYIQLNRDILVQSKNLTKKQNNLDIRANNNKLTSEMVDETTKRIGRWIEEFHDLLKHLPSKATIG